MYIVLASFTYSGTRIFCYTIIKIDKAVCKSNMDPLFKEKPVSFNIRNKR